MPKNELINRALVQQAASGVDQSLQEQFETLRLISEGAEELSLLGRVLSINQGLKGNDFDEFSFVQGIEASVNRIYLNNIRKFNKPNEVERFNLRRFIEDEQYQREQIQQYDNIKNTLNVLQVIASSPHFFEMLQTTINMEDNINVASTSLRLTRSIARNLFNEI
jgi:hypothetical protein